MRRYKFRDTYEVFYEILADSAEDAYLQAEQIGLGDSRCSLPEYVDTDLQADDEYCAYCDKYIGHSSSNCTRRDDA